MSTESLIGADEFMELIRREMHLVMADLLSVDRIEAGFARVRLRYDPSQLRPGATIAGPILFTLADTALYAAVMSLIGLVPLAVTTDMSIHFLRKPQPRDLIAEARILKRGKRLVVGAIDLFSDGEEQPVAFATGTYSVPASD